MSRAERVTAACLVLLGLGLLAIGLVSSLVVRHIIQALPAIVTLAAVSRWRAGSAGAALAVFAFWLLIMTAIWLYLLGVARIITGTFSPAEIVLTIIVGAASACGIVAAVYASRRASLARCLLTFLAGTALQVFAMWLSLQPMFARR